MTGSGVKRGDKLTSSELALDSYMDALLLEPEEEAGAPVADAGATTYHLFEVCGVLVAVPARRVCAEIPLPVLQQDAPQPAWLRRAASGDEAVIVDPALLVLPEDLAPRSIPLQERCGGVLLLDDGSWGMALEEPGHEQTIAAATVCWRGPRGTRPWLAGTLSSRRCVVLDLDNIQQLGRFAGY